METIKNIGVAVIIGLLFAGAWLGLYALALFLIWAGTHLPFYWVIAGVLFAVGAGFYLIDNV